MKQNKKPLSSRNLFLLKVSATSITLTHLHKGLKYLKFFGCSNHAPFTSLFYLIWQGGEENQPHRQKPHLKPSQYVPSSVPKFPTWLEVTAHFNHNNFAIIAKPMWPAETQKKYIFPFTALLLIFIFYLYSPPHLNHLLPLQVGAVKKEPPLFLYTKKPPEE